jgi:hypothetical protein
MTSMPRQQQPAMHVTRAPNKQQLDTEIDQRASAAHGKVFAAATAIHAHAAAHAWRVLRYASGSVCRLSSWWVRISQSERGYEEHMST